MFKETWGPKKPVMDLMDSRLDHAWRVVFQTRHNMDKLHLWPTLGMKMWSRVEIKHVAITNNNPNLSNSARSSWNMTSLSIMENKKSWSLTMLRENNFLKRGLLRIDGKWCHYNATLFMETLGMDPSLNPLVENLALEQWDRSLLEYFWPWTLV